MFRKCWRYVQTQSFDEAYILSAKHGLISPETVIEPYDQTLVGAGKQELIRWSENVGQNIAMLHPSEVTFFAGGNYRKYLIPLLEQQGIRVPLEGMGIGEQLGFYTKAING